MAKIDPNNKKTASKKSFLDEHAGEGTDNITTDDLAIPFLKIAQALSPEIDDDTPEYIPDLKLGMLFNSLTKHIYGKEINLIPLRFQKIWLEWKPKRGGLVGRHEPGTVEVDKTDFSEWVTPTGNVIQETYMFYCLVEGKLEEGPLLFPLQSTGIKHAKNWNSQILMTRLDSGNQAPFFSSAWTITVDKYKNDQGTYYQIGGKTTNIERDRFITEKEFNEYIFPTYENIKQLESKVDFKALEHKTDAVMEEGEDGEIPF